MKKQDYEAIIFDLGGVIINVDYNRAKESFKALGIQHFDDLYSKAGQSSLFDEFEKGIISPQRFINSILDYLPAGTTPNQVVHAWNSMVLDFPPERLELLIELQENHRIFLLSNTNALHWEVVLRHLALVTNRSIDSYFEKVYLSHEVQMRKPHTEIFELVCKENKLNPDLTLFIDDTPGHVEGALKSGLQGYHLKNGETIIDLF